MAAILLSITNATVTIANSLNENNHLPTFEELQDEFTSELTLSYYIEVLQIMNKGGLIYSPNYDLTKLLNNITYLISIGQYPTIQLSYLSTVRITVTGLNWISA